MIENKIKIIIVDDHDLIREGLDRILSFEEDISILGQCKNGKEVLELLEREVPDVILLDINMPILNGIDTLREVKMKFSKIKVIMLTVEDDRRTINEAIDIGADGYILKESAGSEIVNAIKAVSNDEKYIDIALLKIIFHDIKSNFRKEKTILDDLTKIELSILLEISKGLKNNEIAKKLCLSEKAVNDYITNIFTKINVIDRVQATVFAINNNLEEYYLRVKDKEC